MSCYRPISIALSGNVSSVTGDKFQLVPCGHCAGCIKDKQNSWYLRTRTEVFSIRGLFDLYNQTYMMDKDNNPCAFWFVTLTYDDGSLDLPYTHYDKKTKQFEQYFSLRYKDIDDHFHTFNKWHRRRSDKGYSYFGCGEYGERTHRPHYHILLVGLSKNHVQHFVNEWQRKFCPSSLQHLGGQNLNSGNWFYSRNGRLITRRQLGCVVKPVPLWGNGSYGIPDYQTNCCRYVAKYAAKSHSTWYYRLPFKKELEPPKLFSSRYFGFGVTALQSHEHQERVSRRNELIIQRVYDYTNLPGVPMTTPDGSGYNPTFLGCLSDSLRVNIDKFSYKLPQYLYNQYFPKDYEDYFDDVTQTIKKRVVPYSADESFNTYVPICNALSVYRQIKVDELLANKYKQWLSDQPGREVKEHPFQDHDFFAQFCISEDLKNAFADDSSESAFVDYYSKSIF